MSENKDNHGFSVAVAQEVGVNRAIMLQHFKHLQIAFLDKEQSAKEVWVKRSRRALSETYPYFTEKEIRGCLDRLERDEYIRSKVDNVLNYDRTKSYQLDKKGWDLMGEPASDKRANREQKASDKRANGFDKRANHNVTKGPMSIGNCNSIVSSFVGGEERTPAPEKSPKTQPVEADQKQENLAAGAAAAIEVHDPDIPGVVVYDHLAPQPTAPEERTPLRYDQYPNARTGPELLSRLRQYFEDNPDEWRVNVVEQARITWDLKKRADFMVWFSNHMEAGGEMHKTFGQYRARMVNLIQKQKSFDFQAAQKNAAAASVNTYQNLEVSQ